MNAEAWLPTAYLFCLMLATISAAVASAPSITRGLNVPAKVMLSAILAVCATSAGYDRNTLAANMSDALVHISLQALSGIVCGTVVQVALEAARFVGQVAGNQLGLSLASLLDPLNHEESGLLTTLVEIVTILIFLRTDGMTRLVIACTKSATLSPDITWALLFHSLSDSASLGLHLIFPLIVVMLLVDLTVAFFARACPQIPVLTVSLSVKCLFGAWIFGEAMRTWCGPLARHLQNVRWR